MAPPLEPPVVGVAAAAVLYWLGGRRQVARTRDQAGRRRRTASFCTGLAVVLIAVDSPVDTYAGKLFWVHMVQHVLLIAVAPPLILLGWPWLRLWRPLPLGFRRAVARAVARGAWAAPLRAAGHRLAAPMPAWLSLNATLLAWHLPRLYDATLRSQWIHDLEHVTFFAGALLFWSQVVESPPLYPRLDHARRAVYAAGALVVGWVLALVLAFAPSALYSPYAELGSRPGGLSALADQQLSAGVMWVPGSVAYVIAMLVCVYRWLDADSASRGRRRRLAEQH